MQNLVRTIDFITARENRTLKQDTVQNTVNVNSLLNTNSEETIQLKKHDDTLVVKPFQTIDFATIDSILKRSEEREKQIQEQLKQEATLQHWYKRKTDTSEILSKQFGIARFPLRESLEQDPFQQNFLYNIQAIRPEEKLDKQSVFIESDYENAEQISNKKTETQAINEIKPKYIPERVHFDWITILLLASFLLLGWIRLFNKKYLLSLVKSVISYRESNTLFREKNSLMERASFMVNLLFLSNVSVFVIQIKQFLGLSLNETKDYLIYLYTLGALLMLYVYRLIASSLIGYLFLKQKVFEEYFHNVNIYTKNTGLFLFPVVISLQFLPYEYIAVFVYIGIAIVSFLYLLQVIRSFEIINRKNVSIYYL